MGTLARMEATSNDTLDDMRRKEELFRLYESESSYLPSGRFLADLWCAAFVWRKTKDFDYPITHRVMHGVQAGNYRVPLWMFDEVRRLARQYGFFHWHLAFPWVFRLPRGDEQAENAR